MTTIDILIFRLGAHRLAVELHKISSVLTGGEAQSMERLDPRRFLDHHTETTLEDDGHSTDDLSLRAGLLNQDGPPTALILGEVLAATALNAHDLIELPLWLKAHLPSIIYPRCLWTGQNIVWLLNLDTLKRVSRL